MKRVAAVFHRKEKEEEEEDRESLSALPGNQSGVHKPSMRSVYRDGSIVRTDRAGNKRATLPNGTELTVSSSDVMDIREVDGRSTSLEKSGSLRTTKDGTKTETNRFGKVTRTDPNGTVTVRSLRGSVETTYPDQSQRTDYLAEHPLHSSKSCRTLSAAGTERTFDRQGSQTITTDYVDQGSGQKFLTKLEQSAARGSITRTLSAKGKGLARQSSWRVHRGGHAATDMTQDNRRNTKISLIRQRRKSKTANKCLAEGCAALHRYEDQYCHFHGHLAVLSLSSDGTINAHESCQNITTLVEKAQGAHTHYIICSTPECGADGPKDAKERSFVFKTMNHVKALSENAMYSKTVDMGFDFAGSSNKYTEDDAIW
jgi:hypothetical protein